MDWSTSEKQLPLHEIFKVEEMVAEIELNECWRKCEPHILVTVITYFGHTLK